MCEEQGGGGHMTELGSWTTGRILGVSSAYWQGVVLQTAVVLDVFTTLGERSMSVDQLAGELQCEVRGLEMLLNALCAMGVLVKGNGLYSNTEESKTYLVKGSEHYLGYILSHHFYLMKRWVRLPEAVRTGRPIRSGPPESEEEREAFLMGMFNLASLLAPQVARVIDLRNRERLLDLGGGPGTYAIHFCIANPSIKATVYDLPSTEPYARRTIDAYGLSDRISFKPGNYIEQELEGVYDVVWMSHILHSMGPDMCKEVVRKACSVLEPGGVLYIHDFLLNETRDGPLFPALFSLNMLVNTRQGRSYSEGEVASMLKEAGLKDIKRIGFESPNSSGLMCGTK